MIEHRGSSFISVSQWRGDGLQRGAAGGEGGTVWSSEGPVLLFFKSLFVEGITYG